MGCDHVGGVFSGCNIALLVFLLILALLGIQFFANPIDADC